MDKEAQEKILEIAKRAMYVFGKDPPLWLATDILKALQQLGYRKPKEKPPLLSDDEANQSKIEKAIEILEYHRAAVGEVASSDFANALQLGSEALQMIVEFRKTNNRDMLWHLPGETNK